MRTLALVPARGGSKRLPGKNIMELGGLPLIAWTIRAALESDVCAAVVVSTDDPEIAAVALEYGATVPGLRPTELATDTASSVDVAVQSLDCFETKHGPVDGIMLLQPTSPFRTAVTIRRGAALYAEKDGRHPVVSFSPASNHPAWCFRTTPSGMEPFLGWTAIGQRSQDLTPAWALNGAFYLIAPSRLREERTWLTTDTLPLLMVDPVESIDVDTMEDFSRCEDALRTGRWAVP